MSQKLINRSSDLTKLRNEGYEISIVGGFVILSSIPYLDTQGNIHFGRIVSELTLRGDVTTRPATHVVHFEGGLPHNKDGTPITQIVNSHQAKQLANGVLVQFTFSNKPTGGFNNYYDKLTNYVRIICAPACAKNDLITPQTHKHVEVADEESVFNYPDTNSSRAEITALAEKLRGEKVGIIGLGGTGSYLLDLVSKNPVAEIRLIDGDQFFSHNAFRSPGAPTIETLREGFPKPKYLQDIYSRMHRNIVSHCEYIGEDNLSLLDGLTFVFLSLDRGQIKKMVIQYLIQHNVPFIDVGIGVHLSEAGSLVGMLDLTTCANGKSDHIDKRISFSDGDAVNEYSTNIQIAELNSLNAALAVIRWKKLRGFYHDAEHEMYSVYSINVNSLISNDHIN